MVLRKHLPLTKMDGVKVDHTETAGLEQVNHVCPGCCREFSVVGAAAFYSGPQGVVPYELCERCAALARSSGSERVRIAEHVERLFSDATGRT